MRVLFVTARFPWPPDRGDRLTSLALLRVLARDHKVTLLSFVDGREPADARTALDSLGIEFATVPLSRRGSWLRAWLGLLSPEPSQVAFYRSAAMRDRVARCIAEHTYDAIFVQMFRVAQAVRDVEHPAKVLFLGDSLALNLQRAAHFEPWWKRPGIAWEQRRVAAYEVAASARFREAWVVSPVDLSDLKSRGVSQARLVPHGVDDSLFRLAPCRAGAPRVMFVGNMSVPHNVDAAVFAAREVWPLVRERAPGAELWLVGAAPKPAVRELASLPGVTVTGSVPDLAPLWAAAHVMLAPLRFSSGIQNKVLEAMAAGVPVVTTPDAAAGVRDGTGELMRVAADAAGLARETVALLKDPAAANAMAARAREHAREQFSWSALGRELERVTCEAKAGQAVRD
jgi:sugar transferase (PEP-CTERM/EpsH1 system associated)